MRARFICRPAWLAAGLLLLASCGNGGGDAPADGIAPGTGPDGRAYNGITAQEIVTASGTEPFWTVTITPADPGNITASYIDPELQTPIIIPVERFAGRGGVSWSGTLNGDLFAVAATPGPCSDGMSDRSYPFAVMLQREGGTHSGCASTDRSPTELPPQQN